MFDPVRLSHTEIVQRAEASLRGVEREAVTDAFIVSLGSRRLEMRSALGSFAFLQHFPQHIAPPGRGACPVCGEYPRANGKEDLNVLNFERFKWGGVRHDTPLYASFDLQQFRMMPRVRPASSDVAAFKRLLKAIAAAPPGTSSSSLQKQLIRAFKSSKAERDVVVGILGICGILATESHPGYTFGFVPVSERELPTRRFVDMVYPACWWQRTDGINQDALAYWFARFL